MARKTPAVATVGKDRVLKALEEFESTPDNPTTTQDIAGEFNISLPEAHILLNELADDGKIDCGDGTKVARGSWFILTGDEKAEESTPEPAADKPKRKRRTKAEMEAARAAESRDEPFYSPGAEKDTEIMSKGEAPLDAVEVFKLMESFESTAADPTSTQDLATELHASHEEVLKALQVLKYAKLIDSEGNANGDWFIVVPDVTAENAEEVAQGMLSQAVKSPPKPPSSTIFKPAPNALPKGTQVTLSDGTPATVLADEVVRVKAAARIHVEGVGSDIVKHGLALAEPEMIPACPEGVPLNWWDLAHGAVTQSARDWWLAKCETQRKSAQISV